MDRRKHASHFWDAIETQRVGRISAKGKGSKRGDLLFFPGEKVSEEGAET